SQLLADMHIHVDPLISVSEGHSIGDRVMGLLGRKFKRLTDVVVHIDPEDDLMIPSLQDLPLRPEIERAVRDCLIEAKKPDGSTEIEDFDLLLHYVGGRVTGELTFALPASELRGVLEEESQALSERLLTKTPLSAVKIHYRA
ncbi:cation-efflux pump, partial [Gammaproteobacteria bacterium]|nr:cation-efflux pump [Gammaproteobacteria bacterium]